MRQWLSKELPPSRIMNKVDLLNNNTWKSMTGKPSGTIERLWISKPVVAGLNHGCSNDLVATGLLTVI